ncbi:MAG: hypothetical protein JNM18_11410 [Planctomycetaceae bacterium]|nr:hypothetical protein [Planctomycetaceae bacterium]
MSLALVWGRKGQEKVISPLSSSECNSRQYCPSANDGWRERYPTMFKVTDGMLGAAALNGVGLGFDWVETKR